MQTEYLPGKAEILVHGVNLLFFQGRPADMRDRIQHQHPVKNQRIMDPPTVKQTFTLLK